FLSDPRVGIWPFLAGGPSLHHPQSELLIPGRGIGICGWPFCAIQPSLLPRAVADQSQSSVAYLAILLLNRSSPYGLLSITYGIRRLYCGCGQ
ncbi:unnamed protein product, partial [Linum tenue]